MLVHCTVFFFLQDKNEAKLEHLLIIRIRQTWCRWNKWNVLDGKEKNNCITLDKSLIFWEFETSSRTPRIQKTKESRACYSTSNVRLKSNLGRSDKLSGHDLAFISWDELGVVSHVDPLIARLIVCLSACSCHDLDDTQLDRQVTASEQ